MKKGVAKKSGSNFWYWVLGILAVAVILYVIYVYQNGGPQLSPTTYSCTDSDAYWTGESRFYHIGTTTRYRNGVPYTSSTDSCYGRYVREYYCGTVVGSGWTPTCYNNCVAMELKNCVNGCVNGACKSA